MVSSLLLFCSCTLTVLGFTPSLRQQQKTYEQSPFHIHRTTKTTPSTATQLQAYIDVPPGFFTISLMGMSIVLSVSRNVNRARMEELAWEQRLEDSRDKRMKQDPTLTELDLRRQEAANEWSAYGPDAMAERERESSSTSKKKVKVMDYEVEFDNEDFDDDDNTFRRSPTGYGMTDDEITAFEREFGVAYDPYYDDPYQEQDLPDDVTFKVDKQYGDRIYSNGEIFYKDKSTGLYYRQGSKPRISKLW